ncbi:IclR family transcriptional regulator OS=Streptomyces fumanus OX=67302 GN=GCM10018772_64910 PE=4 SV=1 [Streptomyces fumanus]
MSAGETGGGAQVKSAVRTVELLEYFAGRPGMHSLAAVQEAVGYPKSSLYMLLRTLVELGWVETDATGTRYGIGVRALLVGTSYIDGDEVVAAARPTLDRLSDDTTETIHLARLDGTNVVYLATRQSQHYLRPFTRVGRRLPADSTSLGKALLSTYSDQQVRKLLLETLPALTEHTITDREKLIGSCTRCASRASPWTARRTPWGCAASAWRSPTAPPRGTPSVARCRWRG